MERLVAHISWSNVGRMHNISQDIIAVHLWNKNRVMVMHHWHPAEVELRMAHLLHPCLPVAQKPEMIGKPRPWIIT